MPSESIKPIGPQEFTFTLRLACRCVTFMAVHGRSSPTAASSRASCGILGGRLPQDPHPRYRCASLTATEGHPDCALPRRAAAAAIGSVHDPRTRCRSRVAVGYHTIPPSAMP